MNEAKDSLKIIGNAIKKGRMRLGWSQKELAAFMKVVPSLVSKWENGKVVPPGDSLFKMAIELDLVPLLFSDYFSQNSQQPLNSISPLVESKFEQLKKENLEIKQRLSKIEEKVLSLV